MNTTYNEGEEIPVIHPWYPKTWCNVYASDLARTVLFPGMFKSGDNNTSDSDYAPWGGHACANWLHWRIYHNSNFKEISLTTVGSTSQKKDAWQYTQAGYVVYFTAFGDGMDKNLLNSVMDETKIDPRPPGHIATCYGDGKVIQAGSSVGILIWSTAQRAHVYLGYIIKD